MIRKLSTLLLALVLVCSCTVAGAAGYTAYTFDDIGVQMELNEAFNIVLTRDMPADDPTIAMLGLTKDAVDELLVGNKIYLDAMILNAAGLTHEINMVAEPMYLVESLNGLEGSNLEAFMSGVRMSYDQAGSTILSYETYIANGYTHVVLLVSNPQGAQLVQSMTVQNNQTVCITMSCMDGNVGEDDLALMQDILDHTTFNK